MPVINKALVRAGFENISSIVTTFDSGGDSGRLRTDERGKILAYSDYWRALISLWKDGKQKELWEEMLRYRDGRARNFGNLFFQFMTEKVEGLSNVAEYFSKLVNADMKGKVIPVTLEPSEICFRTKSGREFTGEHRLDEMRMSADAVKDIWLQEKIKANKQAITAIIEAEMIIICPGSLYGSIIINFLPEGMAKAFEQSKGKKILMTNIMSTANESDGFDQEDYVKAFEPYLGKDCFEMVLMAEIDNLDKKLLKETLYSYSLERQYPIKYNKKSKISTMVADIALIETENSRFRHSEEKLAGYFSTLVR